ncbi:MAG: hypothetical protein IB616_03000 [Methanosarcinales archaeon]|nr:MAG: hypothetical protein IB616_03000 [Methanosarcinales archaeon]
MSIIRKLQPRKTVVFILILSILAVSFSGCIQSVLPANVGIIDQEVSEIKYDLAYGFYMDVTLKIQNKGEGVARNVKVYVHIEDNTGDVEYDGYLYFPDLAPLDVASKTFTLDLEVEDKSVTGEYVVYWDGGSNTFHF